MFWKKLGALLLSFLLMLSLCSCGDGNVTPTTPGGTQTEKPADPGNNNPTEKDPTEKDPTEKDPAEKDPNEKDPAEKDPNEKDPAEKDPTEKDPNEKDPEEKDPEEEDPMKEYKNLPELRFASYYGGAESEEFVLKMRAPYDDTYTIAFQKSSVSKVKVVDAKGNTIGEKGSGFDVTLGKDQIVYVSILPAEEPVKVDITAKNHLSQLPFDIEGAPDTAKFDTTTVSGDPLKPAEIEAKKRDHGLYIYSNSPESLLPQCLNTALNRNDISNEEVFFTYEHNSHNIGKEFYYGYQVLNTGDEDIFVTVRNVGVQLEGAGQYYGVDEWAAFYNASFELPKWGEWTEEELKTFNAFYGFPEHLTNPQYQPVTYRIPAGKYMYVMGGTTEDAYNGYNVCDTADKLVNLGKVQNGAVLFDVVGDAEGIFYVYDDPAKVGKGNKTHQGLSPDEVFTNNGWETGAVVDMSATWTFNDNTPAQDLPVSFTNYYADNIKLEGNTPFAKINSTAHRKVGLTSWYTHSNVQNPSYHNSLGTDMTAFHTVYNGKEIILGCEYYDARGQLANIGNWMKDYIDTYTFVNRGSRAREITVKMGSTYGGCLSVLARDENGAYIEGSAIFAMVYKNTSYGDAINYPYEYKFTVAAHSVKQISFEYNLLANSYGTVLHSVTLK